MTDTADITAAIIQRIIVDLHCRLAGIEHFSAGGVTEYRLTVAHKGPPYRAYAFGADTFDAVLRKAEAWAVQKSGVGSAQRATAREGGEGIPDYGVTPSASPGAAGDVETKERAH